MANITRDRGCFYYVPWLPTLILMTCIAGLGVWAYYTRQARDLTVNALDTLDIYAPNIDRINDGLLATAITYLVVAMLIYFASLWRSFIEAAHDATGHSSRAAVAYLIINYFLASCWWFVVLWMGLLVAANVVWSTNLYLLYQASDVVLAAIDQYGAASWLPSKQEPCPGQCLDFTQFASLDSDLVDSCVCDGDQVSAARAQFKSAYDQMPGVLTGSWIMLAGGTALLVNFACQFSHTKRERELLSRLAVKRYSAV